MPRVTKQTVKPRKKKSAARSAWDMDTGVKINLYGRSGTGKTTLWATFPGPILALICSGGKQPGELHSIDTPEYRKKITAPTISDARQLDGLVAEQSESGRYATVVLDHLSAFSMLVFKDVLELEKAPLTASWGMATQAQWGVINSQVIRRLFALLSLPCNVIVVAQERDFNTDSEGDLIMPYVASAATPGVVGWLNPACDYICQTFIRRKTKEKTVKIGGKTVTKRKDVRGVEYVLRTAPHDVYTTKFRLPRGRELPDVIVDPSYEKLMRLIEGD